MENNNQLQIPSAQLKLAYPPVMVEQVNSNYGRMMLDNLGGTNSEMTAVASYLHSNLVLDREYPEIADIFGQIGEVEMHHLHMFGQLAEMLGQDPRLWTYVNNRPRYWSPSYSTYSLQLPQILNEAIAGELMAIDKYQKQLSVISDPYIRAILERIILDEEHHIFIFRTIQRIYGF